MKIFLKQNWFKLSVLCISVIFGIFYFLHQEKARQDGVRIFCKEKTKTSTTGASRYLNTELIDCINSFE